MFDVTVLLNERCANYFNQCKIEQLLIIVQLSSFPYKHTIHCWNIFFN